MVIRKQFKRVRNDIIYVIVRVSIGVLRMLPRRAALNIGSGIGRIAPHVARKDFKLAVKHLTMAFGNVKGEKEINRLAHETFRNMAMNFVDTARLMEMSPDDVKTVCVPHHIDRLWDALKEGHGVVMLTSHTGCWELLAAYLTAIGIPLSGIARKLYDPRLETMLTETRKKAGVNIISRGEDTRNIIRVLKRGDVLGILIDQDTRVKGVFVDFFGKPAHTATAPAFLSVRYNSPIIPVFTYRDREHNHHACAGEPVTIESTGNSERDLVEITAQCSKITENFIREHPEQWVWFHKRWKTRPKHDKNTATIKRENLSS